MGSTAAATDRSPRKKVGIVTSHPIQYYAPWFRRLSLEPDLEIRVFYLWDFGVTEKVDRGFQQPIEWDVPLLSGYEYQFVPNISSDPGTHHFGGLSNPALLQEVKKYRPDAVLTMGYNYASLYRFLLLWNSRRSPLIFRGDSHRIVPRTDSREWIRHKVISFIFRLFGAFLYTGKANRDYFSFHGVCPSKLFFSPHAVDNDWFVAQHKTANEQGSVWKHTLGIPESHAVILFAGKYEAKKRPLDLLKAFKNAGLENVALLFVGAGALETEMRKQAGGHEKIFFAPFQNQSLMPRTYAAADIVVLPSFGSSETWGLAVNEAMCMSRPVIVSTHVGCAEDLVKHGKNGLIFSAGDVGDLTHCLNVAFADRSLLARWGDESLRVIGDFSYEQATFGLRQSLSYLNILPPSD